MYKVEATIGACSGLNWTKDVQLKYTTKPLRFDADLCQVQGKI
jgi:hypothetical protein